MFGLVLTLITFTTYLTLRGLMFLGADNKVKLKKAIPSFKALEQAIFCKAS
jgi:hypothetical protein